MINFLYFLAIGSAALVFAYTITTAVFTGYHFILLHPFRLNLKPWPTIMFLVCSIFLAVFLKYGLQSVRQYQYAQEIKILDTKVEEQKALQIAQQQKRDQSIRNKIQEYFTANGKRDISALDALFIFPIQRFFRLEDTPLEKFNERMRFEWRHNKPYNFIITNQNSTITWEGDNAVVDITMEKAGINRRIKLNRELKIYYLRDFYLSPS